MSGPGAVAGPLPEMQEATVQTRHPSARPSRRRAPAWPVIVALVAVIAASCGGGGGGEEGGGKGGGREAGVPANAVVATVAAPDEGTPKRGGTLTYALEGRTDDLCPPSAQWAISGIMIGQAIYDTLTEPDAKGRPQPYLAKSIDHDPTYKVWTIGLRDGIEFHNGEKLDAAAVKANIDAWRKGILLGFVFENIESTRVVDPLTVEVTMKTPWVAFPSYLWTTGRTGIAAPAQLADPAKCSTDAIGTGPFKLAKFDRVSGAVDTVRNPSYWRKGFPYLDGLEFRVQEDGAQRVRGLQSGQFDVIHSNTGADLAALADLGTSVRVTLEPFGRMELNHLLLNVSRPPFDDPLARKALAAGLDRSILSRGVNEGNPRWRLADQVFDTDVVGHLADPGFPRHDVKEAKRLADEYERKHGEPIAFDLSNAGPSDLVQAKEIKRQAAKFGVKVNIPKGTDQGTQIAQAIGGTIDAFLWRNYPGEDPDTMYVWFHSGSTINFNHIDDPVIDRALEEGRANPDPEARRKAYETFNRRLSTEAYNTWTWRMQWFVATSAKVHGVTGPALPGPDGSPGSDRPIPMIAGYHQLLGLWVS